MNVTWADIMTAREAYLCNYDLLSDRRYFALEEQMDIDAFLTYCDAVPVADSTDQLPTTPVPDQLRRLYIAAGEADRAGTTRWCDDQ